MCLAIMLTKHVTGLGQYWTKYIPFAMYSYNTFSSPNLNRLSIYELVFERKSTLLIDLETDQNVQVSGTFKEYYKSFCKCLEYL